VARIPRNVKVLSLVSFFQDAASELLYPVLPLFITGTLGAPASVLGLIEGIAEGTASIGKAVSGRIADRVEHRRPLVALGYGISSVAKPLIGLAGAWPMALVGRFVDRVGKGIRTTPRDALIAADTPPEIRGRAFGLHRAADTAGAVVGPLLGLALYEALDHELRPLFFVAFVPAAISVALIAFVREHPRPPAPHGGRVAVPWRSLPRQYKRTVALLGLFALVNFSDALLILRANELGLGFVGIVLAYTLYNLVYAALSYPAGDLSDRYPRSRVFGIGLLVFAVAYAGLGLASSTLAVFLLLPLYGAYTALTDGVGKAWIADLLPPEAMGTGLGAYQGVTGIGAVVAGVWAGLAWGGDGTTPLIVSGVAAAILAVAVLRLRPTG
jgi:MFS family permease